jgi:hypothetical protein
MHPPIKWLEPKLNPLNLRPAVRYSNRRRLYESILWVASHHNIGEYVILGSSEDASTKINCRDALGTM